MYPNARCVSIDPHCLLRISLKKINEEQLFLFYNEKILAENEND